MNGGEIHMWGKSLNRYLNSGGTDDVESVLLRIRNVRYYVYAELKAVSRGLRYDKETVSEVMNMIKGLDYVLDVEYINMYNYFKFQEVPIIKIYLNSEKDRYRITKYVKLVKLYDRGKVEFKVHESYWDTIIKFLSDYELSMNNWHTFEGIEVLEHKISTCDREYTMDIDQHKIIATEDDDILSTPLKLRTMAFDIETYCQGIFTFCKAIDPSDEVMMITVTLSDDQGNLRNHALIQRHYTGEPIEDTIVTEYENEIELLEAFQKLIIELDPDIITGYNIYGFDLPYIQQRLQNQGRTWMNIGRCPSINIESIHRDAVMPWEKSENTGEDRNKNLQKYKNRSQSNIDNVNLLIPGRLVIDVFPHVKKTFRNLKKYSLDAVAGHFLGEYKLDVSFSDLNIAFRDYDSRPDAPKIYSDAVKYGVQDAVLTYKLFDKLNIFLTLSMYSHITTTSLPDIMFKGDSTPVFRAQYRSFKKANYLFMERRVVDESYQGAWVLDPVVGFHKNVTTLDLNSLYPNVMITYNICPTTFVPDDRVDIGDERCHVLEFVDRGKSYRYRFLKDVDGIVPNICKELIAKRKEVRRRRASTDFEALLNDKLQLALKINVNTIYGAYGIRNHRFSFLEGARAVTAMGRQALNNIVELIETKFDRRVIYGDTDSVMFKNHEDTYEESYAASEKIRDYINDWLPGTLRMDLEKIGLFFLMARKKYKYRYWIPDTGDFEVDKEGKPVYHSTGADSVRRDKCMFQSKLYDLITDWIMDQRPAHEIDKDIFDICTAFLCRYNLIEDRPLKPEDLYINVAVNEANKSTTHAPTMMFNRLKREQYDIKSGERIDTIIVKGSSDKIGDRMYTDKEYCESHEDPSKVPLSPDLVYYLEKRLTKSIDDIFATAFGHQLIQHDRIRELLDDVTEIPYENSLDSFVERYQSEYNSQIDTISEPILTIIDEILEEVLYHMNLPSPNIDDSRKYILRYENILICVDNILLDHIEFLEDSGDSNGSNEADEKYKNISVSLLESLHDELLVKVHEIFKSNTTIRDRSAMYRQLADGFKEIAMMISTPLTRTLDAKKEHIDKVVKEIREWGEVKCWHILNTWNKLVDEVPILKSFYSSKTYDHKTPYQRLQYIRGRKIRASRTVSADVARSLHRYKFKHDRFVKEPLTWFGSIQSPIKYINRLVKARESICSSITTGVTLVQ